MPPAKINGFEFKAFAERCGSSADDVLKKMKAFDGSQVKLSSRAIEKMRSEGISLRNTRTRTFLQDFVKANFPEALELSGAQADDFLVMLVEKEPASARQNDNKAFSSDPEIFATVSALTAIRDRNEELQAARKEFSGYYYLVRRTSRDDGDDFYEEPFFLGDQGERSFLIQHRQNLSTGFSFASNSICSTILTNRHAQRTLGASMIMLFADDGPERGLFTGVMLRFSDDMARPAASQVLARRVHDKGLTDQWSTEVDAAMGLQEADHGSDEARSAISDLKKHALRIVKGDEPSSLYRFYEVFSLKHHAKAFNQTQIEKVVASLSDVDEDLLALLGA